MSDEQPIFGPREAVTLDGMMKSAGLEGWDMLEKLLDPKGEMQGELENTAKSVAPLIYGLALSSEGREILEWLCDITVRRPTFIHGMGIEQAALYAANREGQAGVIFTILKAIKTGQEIVGDRAPTIPQRPASARPAAAKKKAPRRKKGPKNV